MARFIGPAGGTGDTTHHMINAKNASNSVTIPKGSVVMFAGSAGDTVTISLASFSSPEDYLVGIAHEEIAPEGFGEIVQFGTVENVKTDYTGWQLGDLLYLDENNPGQLTNTAPALKWYSPIAAVTRLHAETGRLLVRAIPTSGNATIINTDGNPGKKIYIGSVDPNTLYTLQLGDIWIETA